MRVGVLSDTHIQSFDAGATLAQKLLNGPFADVDIILHAGDNVYPDLASCFYPIPWYGVRGNMDVQHAGLPMQRIVRLANVKIGMVHGWGLLKGIEPRVINCFDPAEIDVLVFGHSHRSVCHKIGSVLVFNPGSPTDRRSAPFHTVGILHIGAEVKGEIIRID